MALTFEELETYWLNHNNPEGNFTLVRTQEDGRTGYSHGGCAGYDPSMKRSHFGYFSEQFSDRSRQLPYVPPSTGTGSYSQNFDVNEGIEQIDFEFLKTAARKYELRMKFFRWGSAATVTMTKAAQGKIYTGWGATIGNTSTRALYVLSINSASEDTSSG